MANNFNGNWEWILNWELGIDLKLSRNEGTFNGKGEKWIKIGIPIEVNWELGIDEKINLELGSAPPIGTPLIGHHCVRVDNF